MSDTTRTVLVVGAGLIGTRRAREATAHPTTSVSGVCDIRLDAAQTVCDEFGGKAFTDWQDALHELKPNICVVSTTNKYLAPVALAALEQGADVLIEKPMGRNADEARQMHLAAEQHGKTLKIGFNHRYHPAVMKSVKLAQSGELGDIKYVRCIYGHGGRPGYENEWRGSLEECGGGELLDQGVHVLDLIQWLLGTPEKVQSTLRTFAWPIDPLEDNAFATLEYAGGQVATFHTSWTQWRNRFEWQIYGSLGAAEVNGIGGSYGKETLTVYKRKPEGGVPDIETEVFDGPDESWTLEWQDFVSAIENGTAPLGSSAEGLAVMETLERLRS